MTRKTLRPYQQQAYNDAFQEMMQSDDPVLLMASVGAGKSLIIAEIVKKFQQHNKRVLCLVNNAELVRNNCQTFIEQGGRGSIYCAALGEKECAKPVVFGTPVSVLNAIKKETALANIQFNLIVVDEAHNIDYTKKTSAFMRILQHYKQAYAPMRVLGATGTNFRFKGSAILGDKCLFKKQIGNITTEQLIDEGYLIKPTFEIDNNLSIDFSNVAIKNGQFDKAELSQVVDQNERLTKLICHQVVTIMEQQNRFGVFLFATTRKHAQEILSYLPPEQSALILGETPQAERTEILNKAREGEIKYLVNIAIISVGVDVPAYDTIAYLRPTESLVLMVQTMGRALRLSPSTNKTEALVLDFAGNIERFKDWDNPIILDAIKKAIFKDKDYTIKCPACMTLNPDTARRCIGIINDKRCDYYFESKICSNPQCQAKNDIAARLCRLCDSELIDPNDKLSIECLQKKLTQFNVSKMNINIKGNKKRFTITLTYYGKPTASNEKQIIQERYTPSSTKAMRVFYGQFVKKHIPDASRYYPGLQDYFKVKDMMQHTICPNVLLCKKSIKGWVIKKRLVAGELV